MAEATQTTRAEAERASERLGGENAGRRWAEDAAGPANLYNRSLIEASLDPLVTIGPEGRITDVNRATEAVTGLSREELVGTDFAECFTEPERARSGYEQAFRDGAVSDYPLDFRHKDGRVTPVLYNASAYRDEAGKVVGVFAAARDVTATRRIVESLRASEAKFRIVSDNTYDWEYWLDPQGRFVYCSPSCERLTGHKAEAFLAEPGLLEGLVFPEDWADYRRHVRTTLESPGAEAGEGSGELQFRIIRSDGTIRWVGHVCRAVFDEEKRFLGVRGSNRDITDRKVAEQEFVRLNAELEDRVAERTADLRGAIEEMEGLSYSVAHDLRAPVQAIHGFATLLAKQYGDLLDERGRHLLGAVEKAARQGELLIDDLLAFHRVGRTALVRVPIDMTALVKEVVSEAIPADGDRPVHVSVEEVPDAKGDPELVRTLLENLLSNAVKFSAKREEPVVEVGCRAGPDGPKYFVRDNGVGFEMKSASRLFGLFDRLHGGDEYPGNGIGLALVKRIVERHGGRVWAEGEVDRGATFWFTLGRAGDGRSRPMPRVRVDV